MADFTSGIMNMLGRPNISPNQFDKIGSNIASVINGNQEEDERLTVQYTSALLNAAPEQRQAIVQKGLEVGAFDEEDAQEFSRPFEQIAPVLASYLQSTGNDTMLPDSYRNDKKLSVKGVEGDMLFTDGKGNYFSNQTFLDPNTQTTNSILTDISGNNATPDGELMPVNKMGQTIQQKREDDKKSADDALVSQVKFKGAIAKAISKGKLKAADEDSLETKVANMPLIENIVSDLRKLAPIATNTFSGGIWDAAVKETGFGATKGKTARTRYQSIIANQTLPLLKATFGAAFTAAEGQKLEATLGDPNAAPEEKLAALDAFIDAQRSQIQALERKLNASPVENSSQGQTEVDDAEYEAMKAELGI